MLEGLSLSTIMPIVSMLGLPGLVLIFWYVDQRRLDQERKDHRANLAEAEAKRKEEVAMLKEQFLGMITTQEKRFDEVVRMYESNVLLVKGYERYTGDMADIIALVTQVMTKLGGQIENNMYCPLVREKGPRG